MTRRWGIAHKLALAFALGPVALVIIGAVAYHSTIVLLDARRILLHTYEVRASIAKIAAHLIDAETGQRGFLLTGTESYLAPYNAAVRAVGADVDSFARLTSDNPHQQGRLPELRALVAQKVDELRETLRLRRDRGLPAALALVRTNRGKLAMDAIRAILADADAEEVQLEAARGAAARDAANGTLGVITYGTLLTVLLLAGIGAAVIRSIGRPVEEAVAALTSATSEILAGSTQQRTGAQEQMEAISQTAATVEEIAQTAEQSDARAKAVADSSQRAVDNGMAGRKAVEDSIAVMSDVKARAESVAEGILALAERAQAIGDIIGVVSDVAEQTNMLALNAAIEASRAGDYGKGFSVVAAEIKSLAHQSKQATVQVRDILSDIQKATNNAVMVTEDGTKTVERAMQTVNLADDAIRVLADTIAEASQAAMQISASVGQQAVGMTQIRQAMRAIRETTNQHLASTRQAEQAARDLDSIGMRLRTMLRGSAA